MAELTPEEIDARLKRLQEATDALPRHKLPGYVPYAGQMDRFDYLNYRTKDPDKYDADQRRAYFLEQAEQEIGPARTWSNYGMGQLAGLTTRENMKRLRSTYEPYAGEGQMLGEDHPVYKLAVWAQSVPSADYAAGKMLADEFRPEGVPANMEHDRKWAKSINTFGLGIPGALGLLPDESRWKDLDGMRAQMARPPGDQPAWRTLDPSMWEAVVQASRQSDMLEGRQYLKDAGVSEKYANAWGDLMDATLDPLNSLGQTMRLARMGKSGAAAKALAVDYGLGTATATVPMAMDSVQQIREFLERRR